VAGLVASVEGAGVAGVAGVALVEGVLLVDGAAALSAGPGVAGAVTAGVLLISTPVGVVAGRPEKTKYAMTTSATTIIPPTI